MTRWSWVAAMAVTMTTSALAEDDAQRRAREELERQLAQMVDQAPSRVRIEFQPLDDPNLQLEELVILLDNKPVKAPSPALVAGWIQDGPMPVAVLDVTPERHLVTVRVSVHNTASPLVVDDGDVRWRVSGDVRFDVNPGLEVRVIVTPVRDARQQDPLKRLKLTFPSQPVMITALDDGKMPEPPKPRPLVVAPVDAGLEKAPVDAEGASAARPPAVARREVSPAPVAPVQAALPPTVAMGAAPSPVRGEPRPARPADEGGADPRPGEALRRVAAARAETAQQDELEKRRRLEAVARRIPVPSEAAQREPLTPEGGAPGAAPAAGSPSPSEDPAAPHVDGARRGASGAPGPEAPATGAPADGPPWLILGGAVGLGVVVLLVVLARRSGRVPKLED